MTLDALLALAQLDRYPEAVVEAAKVVLVHDLAVALSARPLVAALLEPPERSEGACTDLLAGGRVDMASAVSRNGQLIHALTQDDTLLPAMTHVGATAIPLLLALGES